jgi:hypothetical protein
VKAGKAIESYRAKTRRAKAYWTYIPCPECLKQLRSRPLRTCNCYVGFTKPKATPPKLQYLKGHKRPSSEPAEETDAGRLFTASLRELPEPVRAWASSVRWQKAFVETELVPKTLQRLRSYAFSVGDEDKPYGDRPLWGRFGPSNRPLLIVPYTFKPFHAVEFLSIPIYVHSGAEGLKADMVPKGGAAHTLMTDGTLVPKKIRLYLNRAATPNDIKRSAEAGTIDTCRHKRCLSYAFYTVLLHELTHISEKRAAEYGRDVEKMHPYARKLYLLNEPGEIRAYMQQVVDEALSAARRKAFRDLAKTKPNPNHYLLDRALRTSTEWAKIESGLTDETKARFYRAVEQAIREAGLFF